MPRRRWSKFETTAGRDAAPRAARRARRARPARARQAAPRRVVREQLLEAARRSRSGRIAESAARKVWRTIARHAVALAPRARVGRQARVDHRGRRAPDAREGVVEPPRGDRARRTSPRCARRSRRPARAARSACRRRRTAPRAARAQAIRLRSARGGDERLRQVARAGARRAGSRSAALRAPPTRTTPRSRSWSKPSQVTPSSSRIHSCSWRTKSTTTITTPPGRTDARHLADRVGRGGQVVQHHVRERRVERSVLDRQRARLARAQLDARRRPRRRASRARPSSMRGEWSTAITREAEPRELAGEDPGAGADVGDAQAAAHEPGHRAAAQRVVVEHLAQRVPLGPDRVEEAARAVGARRHHLRERGDVARARGIAVEVRGARAATPRATGPSAGGSKR